MTRLRALKSRLSSEGGFTLIELLASMTILMTVMGGLTGLMVSGTKAEVDMNRRFQAHTEARIALDRLRSEVHCATSSSVANPATTVTLTMAATCPTSGGNTQISWCTIANGTGRYGLWRYTGAACPGVTGRKVADYLTTATVFIYTPPAGSTLAGTGQLGFLGVTLDVNLTPTKPERVYQLADRIVLRNTARPA